MMSLLKKWRKHDNGSRIPVKHAHNGQHESPMLSRFRDFRDQIDRVFEEMWRRWDNDPWGAPFGLVPEPVPLLATWPAVDMAEDDKAVTLRVDVPGLDEKDLEIEVSGNVLTLRGSREDEWDDIRHGIRRRERVSGSFTRTLTLPSYVDTQNIEARYHNGTLTITAPKLPGQGPRRVKILPG
jgi:HSP20 family protein